MLHKELKYDPITITQIKVNTHSHIHVKEKQTCQNCQKRPCTYICPSQVYEWQTDRLSIEYKRCVECGACLLACPKNNLDWEYPQGGWGVAFKNS